MPIHPLLASRARWCLAIESLLPMCKRISPSSAWLACPLCFGSGYLTWDASVGTEYLLPWFFDVGLFLRGHERIQEKRLEDDELIQNDNIKFLSIHTFAFGYFYYVMEECEKVASDIYRALTY